MKKVSGLLLVLALVNGCEDSDDDESEPSPAEQLAIEIANDPGKTLEILEAAVESGTSYLRWSRLWRKKEQTLLWFL